MRKPSTVTHLYCVTNKTTGKLYVGVSRRSVRERWGRHVSSARSPRTRLHGAIAQYGADDFVVETLHTYDTHGEALWAEEALILNLDLLATGLNSRPGGVQSPMWNPEVRSKMSASLRGRTLSPEHRAAIGRAGLGRRRGPHSEAVRARISAAKRGVSLSEEHRKKIGDGVRGQTRTPETKTKQSAARHAWWDRKRAEDTRAAL